MNFRVFFVDLLYISFSTCLIPLKKDSFLHRLTSLCLCVGVVSMILSNDISE